MIRAMVCLAMLVASAGHVHAGLIFSGDFQTGDGKVQITEDIEYEITQSYGAVFAIVFDNIVNFDGTENSVAGTPSLSYDISGNSTTFPFSFVDNYPGSLRALSQGDALFRLGNNSPGVTVGDTFTLKSGTYSFAGTPNFNPVYNGLTFEGSTFLIGGGGVQISNVVSAGITSEVPEPTSIALWGLGSLGIGVIARRRKKQLAA